MNLRLHRSSSFLRLGRITAWCLLVALVVVRAAIAAFALHGSPLCKAQKIQDTPAIDWGYGMDDSTRDQFRGSVVVWRDFRAGNTDPDIYAQMVDTQGRKRWPNVRNPAGDGIPLCTRVGVQRNPLVAISSAGRIEGFAWFAWIDERDGSPRVYANGRDLAIGNAGALAPNGVRVCTDEHEQRTFDITGDDVDGAIVVWADNRNDGKDFDIYAQRIGKGEQGGIERAWGDNGKLVCSQNGKQSRPRVAHIGVNPTYYVVVWEDERNGANDRDLYAQRLDQDGATEWAAEGEVVCNAPRHQQQFDMILTIGRRAWFTEPRLVVTWQDHRNATTDSLAVDIYAQKFDSSCDPLWPDNQPLGDGIPVCTAAGAQLRPKVTSDGVGGAYMVWLDKRANPTKLYRQRVENTGTVKWQANGHEGAATPADETRVGYSVRSARANWKGDLYELALTSTESAGDTGVNILCDLFGANDGKKLHSITLCKAILDQYQPVAVVIGNGLDVMAAWRDDRKAEAEADIYATFGTFKIGKEPQPEQQRAPLVTGATPPLPDRVMLLPNHPNPFSTTTSFRVGLPHASDLSIDVFDVVGRRVSGRRLSAPAGWQDVVFDGRSETGPPLPSGVYFCRVNANGQTATRKFVIQR